MVNNARGQLTACVPYCGNLKHLLVDFLPQERFQSAVMRKPYGRPAIYVYLV